mmetsp:Transcript_19776/g.66887  ORF Transcript_19776/g.66887 Transcript_19776/m.66887 type:complete len:307 (-) Transcript_19776:395-1315(-)
MMLRRRQQHGQLLPRRHVARVHRDEPEVDGAPLPAAGLGVAGGDGGGCGAVGDALAADREEDRLDSGLAAGGVKTSQKHMPIFRNHRRVPVLRLDDQIQRQGVDCKRELVVQRVGQLAEKTNAQQRVSHGAEEGNVVAVWVELRGALPEASVSLLWRARDVRVRQRREMRTVEVRVRVAHRHHHAVRRDAALVHELALGTAHRPVLVGTLAADFSVAQSVERDVHGVQLRRELLREKRGRLERARVAGLHREHDHNRRLGVALSCDRPQSPSQRRYVLLVGRDGHDVQHVLVRELIRATLLDLARL